MNARTRVFVASAGSDRQSGRSCGSIIKLSSIIQRSQLFSAFRLNLQWAVSAGVASSSEYYIISYLARGCWVKIITRYWSFTMTIAATCHRIFTARCC